jgi:Flp pilus assembly protein TadG
MTDRNREAGSATVELVLLTPLLVAVLMFVVVLGRVGSARAEVDAAARDAARAASIARSPTSAVGAGESAARAALHVGGVTCRQLTVTVGTGEFRSDGTVSAQVSCTVELADLRALGLGITRTITATHTAPIDRYRRAS